jgi:hypothetical protein
MDVRHSARLRAIFPPTVSGHMAWSAKRVAAVVLLGAVLLAVVGAAVVAARPSARVEDRTLTARGSALWEFEALLRDTYRAGRVCVRDGRFVGGSCTPLATHSPYFFTFARARNSRFHLTNQRAGRFGVKADLVSVRGRAVACDASERRFLIRYFTAASFSLDCVPPLR